MRIAMNLSDALKLADELYEGESKPLTEVTSSHDPLNCSWWRGPARIENFNSERHYGALALYMKIGSSSLNQIPEYCFPSKFDFYNRKKRIPDKGFIKMCLNVEPKILACRPYDAHLLFEISEFGRSLIKL